ncbi:MAG: Na(+)-translocating NADH-quinone reductase subunit A [Bacteroidota bacterium]|nr:Na(+)-translocating NADH-quinone reductase subunit A [Bacteroidota bacterium]
MSLKFNLNRGFNINLEGRAVTEIGDDFNQSSFAIKPTDFIGITRPKLLVEIGDEIKAGSPILFDKLQEDIMYCSPVSGEVIDVIRGEKRRLEEIRILPDKKNKYIEHKAFNSSDIKSLSREKIVKHLAKSGVWPNIIQRPFGLVAETNVQPKSIHVSFFDTSPLAPSYEFMYNEELDNIKTGLDVLSRLTEGKIHLNHNSESIKIFKNDDYENNIFSGPHPAGNVGVQIHHIDPINKNDIVWSTSPFGLIQIGKLFNKGIYDASKIISLVGSCIDNPKYYRCLSGFSVVDLIKSKVEEKKTRVISGNVLTGTAIGYHGYLGFYDNMVTIIPEGDDHTFLGWIMPVFNKLSFQRAFGLLSFLSPNKKYNLDTNTNGELRAFVQSGVFEKVLPMDILPTYLFKSILAEDYDEMEELGIYELVEEDIALCEFVDVSKNELQLLLRKGLNMLKEG